VGERNNLSEIEEKDMLSMNQPLNLAGLEQVMDYAPLIVASDTTVLAAITSMNQPADSNSTHSPHLEYSYVLVVDENNKPIGILTARDVVRLTALGTDLAGAKITEVMKQPVVRSMIDAASDVLKTLSFMRLQHLDHLPIVDDQGRLLGMVTTRDLLQLFDPLEPGAPSNLPLLEKQLITVHECRQHELELLSNQHRLEAFFSQSPDGFFFMMLEQPINWNDAVNQEAVLDHVFSHQKVTKVNAAMLAQYDATEDEFIGWTPADFFAHDLATGRQLWQDMFDKGRIHVETFEHKLDGTAMWIEGDYSCLYNSAGQIIGHFGIQRDISDRKRAAEELQQSQQDLTDFVENAIVSLHWVAADGTIIWANQTELDLLGYTREEYIGHSITQFHADQDTIADILQRLLSNQPVQEYEADLRCKDGSIRRVLIDSNSSWSEGEFVRTRCFTRDITDRKLAEDALRQSEQKFRAIFDGMFQFMGVLTPTGIIIEANQTALDAIAAKPEDVIGQMFWATPWWTHSPVLQEQLKEAIARAAQGELVRFEAEHILANGTSVFVDFTLKPVVDEGGKVIMLIPEGRDITDRRQAETHLRQQEEFLKSIYDGTEQAIFVVDVNADRELHYASFNPVSEKFAGVTNDQIQGKTPEEAFGEEFGSNLRQNYERSMQAAVSITYEEQLNFPTHSIWTLTTLVPLCNEQDQIYRIIGTATDITDRKQAELELQSQKQDLARSNAELQQFAYVASHDLQEPLRMITSYLELLERRYKGQLDEKADKFIAYAVDGATRMQILINDLLSYSRVGTTGKDWASVDCEKIVQNVLSNLHLSIAQSYAIITHDVLPKVHADSSQMTQLFQNLISNAIKFHGEEIPQIHIGVESNHGNWLFSVQDNGIGMEVQYLERIFIIFQRLHSKTEYPGTGIGLAVCKKIVERHGGNLRVESQPGQGSTFYFTIPQTAGDL
jgi:PAS domain S-box-containing protein